MIETIMENIPLYFWGLFDYWGIGVCFLFWTFCPVAKTIKSYTQQWGVCSVEALQGCNREKQSEWWQWSKQRIDFRGTLAKLLLPSSLFRNAYNQNTRTQTLDYCFFHFSSAHSVIANLEKSRGKWPKILQDVTVTLKSSFWGIFLNKVKIYCVETTTKATKGIIFFNQGQGSRLD